MQIQLDCIRLIMSNSHITLSKRGDDLSIINFFLSKCHFILSMFGVHFTKHRPFMAKYIFPFQMWCLLVQTQYMYHYLVQWR
jgi:hypothetical protein